MDSLDDYVGANLGAVYKPPPENAFRASYIALKNSMNKYTSYGRYVQNSELRARNDYINQSADEGRIPREILNQHVYNDVSDPTDMYGETDYNALARYMRDVLNDKTVEDDDTLNQRISDRVNQTEMQFSKMWEDGGLSIKTAMLMGMAAPIISDPIYFPTYYSGIGAARVAAVAGRASLGAKVAGGAAAIGATTLVEGGAEGAKQLILRDWASDMGNEFDINGAMTEIAFALAIPPALTGVEYAFRLRKASKAMRSTDQGGAEAIDRMADTIEDAAVNGDTSPPNEVMTNVDRQLNDAANRGPMKGQDARKDVEVSPVTDSEMGQRINQAADENPNIQMEMGRYTDELGQEVVDIETVTQFRDRYNAFMTNSEIAIKCLVGGV